MLIPPKICSAFPLLNFSGFELGCFDTRCCRPKKLVFSPLCWISRVFYVFSIYYGSIKWCQRSPTTLLSPCELKLAVKKGGKIAFWHPVWCKVEFKSWCSIFPECLDRKSRNKSWWVVSSRTSAPELFCCGILPRAGTWSQTLLWDSESGRCSIHGGMGRGWAWKQDEIASHCGSKKWFSQRVCEYSGLVWGWFFNCCECSPRWIPTCWLQGKHGLA